VRNIEARFSRSKPGERFPMKRRGRQPSERCVRLRRWLENGPATLISSFRSPVKGTRNKQALGFNMLDASHLMGFSIPGDILLFLGLPNNFDQTHLSDTAKVAADLESKSLNEFRAWSFAFRYAPRIHNVDNNYFQGLVQPFLRSALQQLYNQCTSER
jgi:hypothetical protein